MKSGLRVQRGYGLDAVSNALGTAFNLQPAAGSFSHPWQTRAQWIGATRQWVATVKAGFVNEEAPVFRTVVSEQEALGRDFGTNPLTGQPYFSSPVFAKDRSTPPRFRLLELPLYLSPAIPLEHWRALGSDGDQTEAVPLFFLDQGVSEFGTDVRADETRLLRAMDLILHQPRVALTSNISFEPGVLTGENLFKQTLTTRLPLADDTLKVYAGLFHLPDAPDPLSETYEEQAYDELKISTVYLLSPYGATPGSEPDGTWTAFVQHQLFWNVSWIPAPLLHATDLSGSPNPLAGLGVLGGGLLAPITNIFSAVANDAEQRVFNILQAKSQAGTWWTPTGGGHLAKLPVAKPTLPKGIAGLDRTARLKAQIAAAARTAAARPSGLDPAFPYAAIGFPPERLRSGSLRPPLSIS